jgi:energy-coupling factor transporter transmembrane protein EcfT
MRLQASHWVEETGNTSRATLSIRFSGLLGPLFARLTRNLNDRYLALEAKGLRESSERNRD